MVGSWSDMNQGSRLGRGTAFMTGRGSEEPCPKGDRASVVAKKRGNARGVKGSRKVSPERKNEKENSTVMSNGLSSVKSKSKYANLRL